MKKICFWVSVFVLFSIYCYADWESDLRPAPSGNHTIEAIWSNGSNIYVVGFQKILQKFDGAQWTTLSSSGSGSFFSYYDIWGLNENSLYIVGSNDYGDFARWNGQQLEHIDITHVFEYGPNLQSIWGADEANIFITNYSDIVHFDGAQFTNMASGISSYLWDIFGFGIDDIYAVGANDTILHYDGTEWTSIYVGTNQTFYAVWGSNPNDIFVVGSAGRIRHFDGNNWEFMATNVSSDLRTVWGVGNGVVYAGGGYPDTVLLKYDGTTWKNVNIPNNDLSIHCIWGNDENNVYAFGYNSGSSEEGEYFFEHGNSTGDSNNGGSNDGSGGCMITSLIKN